MRSNYLLPVFLFSGLLLGAVVAPLSSQIPEPLGARAVISVVTEDPGKELYLAFGHTAFRVRDPDSGMDLLFNYGTIDPAFLTSPSFVGRFLFGDLRYSLSVGPFQDAARYDLQTENRLWTEQILNLSLDQVNAVYRYLLWNAQPEHRDYHYDFIKDNCASRIPQVLETVLGPVFQYPAAVPGKPSSARQLIEGKLVDRFPWNVLVSLGLGLVADRPLSPRHSAFMPDQLRLLYSLSSIRREGREVPLVKDERPILVPRPENPVGRGIDGVLVLWLLAAVVVSATVRNSWRNQPVHRRWWKQLPDRALFFLAGAAGLLLAYLSFFSQHFAVQGNLNLVWLWPSHIVVACIPWVRKRASLLRWYWLASAIISAVAVLGSSWGPQPGLALTLPLVFLVASRSFCLFFVRLRS